VFLFEIPLGFVSDPYSGLDRELARAYGLELISERRDPAAGLFQPLHAAGALDGAGS